MTSHSKANKEICFTIIPFIPESPKDDSPKEEIVESLPRKPAPPSRKGKIAQPSEDDDE